MPNVLTTDTLLGKVLIALGITIFGDNPVGWRACSTLAGTATVLGGYTLLLLLLRDIRFAAFGAILIALNQMVFVQARIAMLDGFMGAFLIWGIVLLIAATRVRRPHLPWIAGCALLGAAVAVKWAAVPYVAFAGIAGFVHFTRGRRGMRSWTALLLTGGVSLAVYVLSFLPAFFYRHDPLTLAQFLPLHRMMYTMLTGIVAPSHPYQSHWWDWPLMLRPMWYFYQFDLGAVRRGVFLIGNPVILWGGLVAIAACGLAWFRECGRAPLGLALLWGMSLALWAITPKPLGYFYYYYLPCIFLCLATAAAFHHYDRGMRKGHELWFTGAAALCFAYFYPILSAAPLATEGAFATWTWFAGWR